MKGKLIKHDKVKKDDGSIVEVKMWQTLAEDFYKDMERYKEGNL